MLRRLFDTHALISLTICIAAFVFLVRSERASDFFVVRRRVLDPSTREIELYTAWSQKSLVFLMRTRGTRGHTRHNVILATSYGPIAAAAEVLPAFWLLHRCFDIYSRRRNRRVARGLCFHCGYDLRASTDRCPECGAGIAITGGPRFAAHRSAPFPLVIRQTWKLSAWFAFGAWVYGLVLAGMPTVMLITSGASARIFRGDPVEYSVWPIVLLPLLLSGLLWSVLFYRRSAYYFVATQEGIEVCDSRHQPFLMPWRHVGSIRASGRRGVVIRGPNGIRIAGVGWTPKSDNAKLLAMWCGFGVAVSDE